MTREFSLSDYIYLAILVATAFMSLLLGSLEQFRLLLFSPLALFFLVRNYPGWTSYAFIFLFLVLQDFFVNGLSHLGVSALVFALAMFLSFVVSENLRTLVFLFGYQLGFLIYFLLVGLNPSLVSFLFFFLLNVLGMIILQVLEDFTLNRRGKDITM
ncbi:MAG: hypothetical protein ACOCXP_04030 [Candidatus Dojkabacteria bacterium]